MESEPERLELNRPWVPPLTGGLVVLALLIASLVMVAEIPELGMVGPITDGPAAFHAGLAIDAAMIAGLFAAPVFVFGFGLAAVGPMWTPPQRIALILAVPVGVAVLVALPEIGFSVAGESGVRWAGGTAVALVLIGGGAAVWRITAAGTDAARAADPG